MIEHASSPGDVFHAIVENAVQLHGTRSTNEDLMNELFSNEDLASVSVLFMHSTLFLFFIFKVLVLYQSFSSYIACLCCVYHVLVIL